MGGAELEIGGSPVRGSSRGFGLLVFFCFCSGVVAAVGGEF